MKKFLPPTVKKACSFERIYFQEVVMPEIYQERKN
jgi:amidophosphoribosyltransferase